MKVLQSFVADQLTGRQIIYKLIGLIEAFLLVRFIFKLLAVEGNPVFWLTGPLVAPFKTLFKTVEPVTGASFEPYTLVALLFFAVIGLLVAVYFAFR